MLPFLLAASLTPGWYLSFMLSAHTWLTIALCALPLLIWIPLRLLDAGKEPDNSITHEQDSEGDRDEAEMAAAA